MIVDLNRNTIDDVPCPPKVVELVSILKDGPVATTKIISRLYGASEPDWAAGCIKYHAFTARTRGIPVHGRNRRHAGGFYWIS